MYALFAFYEYYPGGGVADFKGARDTREAAQALLTETEPGADWAHVVDLTDPGLPIVAEYARSTREWQVLDAPRYPLDRRR